jgi:putative spermidine/putrescine transport system substrate-binding protein
MDTQGWRLSRRTLLTGAAGLALTAGRTPRAFGAAKELVLCDWGGASTDAFKQSWIDLVQSRYGLKFVIDSANPSPGKIRAMVESGKVIWDVCDTSSGGSLQLGEAGLLEEIDYSIVSKAKVRPEFAFRWSVCNYMFSYVMAVNRDKFGTNPPRTWADFYDVKRFPGRRTLRALVEGQLEGALLADGVAPKDLYPLNVERALAKIKSIKEHVIFWKTGAESEDLFRRGEVVAGNLWSSRANVLRKETSGRIGWVWDGAILAPAVWVVPKGNPAGKEAAMRLLAALQDPEGQAAYFKSYGAYPANPAAARLAPPDLKPLDGSQPEHVAVQIPFNVEWYGKHTAEVQARYLEMMSS